MTNTYIQLATGAQMPQVGLGTWQSKPEEIDLAVRTALDVGYRLIDTASLYQNETDIGNVLQEYFNKGTLRRQDVFVTTKIHPGYQSQPDTTETALRGSLAKLKLDYVDLYLVHVPVAFNEDLSKKRDDVTVEQSWKGMEAVYEKGLAKAIGLSNHSASQIQRIYDTAKIKPHNLQVEAHVYWPQLELQELCKKLNISFTAYAPLGSPGRAAWKPPAGSGVTLDFKETGKPLEDQVVLKLAKKYNKTSGQILIRYLMERNISPIPKSVNPNRIKENFQVFDFSLTTDEVKELNGLAQEKPFFMQDFLTGHPEDPFTAYR